jgi:hypothetical protein
MRYLAAAAALGALLAMPAQAAQPGCKAQAAETRLSGPDLEAFMARCEKDARAARRTSAPRTRGLSRADEDDLTRAMNRNVLRSIDDQLRLRGN